MKAVKLDASIRCSKQGVKCKKIPNECGKSRLC